MYSITKICPTIKQILWKPKTYFAFSRWPELDVSTKAETGVYFKSESKCYSYDANLGGNPPIQNDLSVYSFPQLDLHGMNRFEAIVRTRTFLKENEGKTPKVYIIIGKGNHCGPQGPVLRPIIGRLLKDGNYEFSLVHDGGCYEVILQKK